MTTLIALALLAQAPTNVPADAEIVYGSMPSLTPVANVDGFKTDVVMTIHSVTGTLSKTGVAYESLTLYKNNAGFEGSAVIEVDFGSYRSGFGKEIVVTGTWSDMPLPTPEKVIRYPEHEKAGNYFLRYTVGMKKSATHSLRLKYSLPVGKSGIDREERLVAYRVRDLGQTNALDQFRMTLKYNPSLVFVRIEGKPDWGWQIGENGAYLKLDGRKSDKDAVLVFRYYPEGL